MHFLKYSVVFFFAVMIAGCATSPRKAFPPPNDYVPISQVQISSNFNTMEITRENLALETNKCVPQLNADTKSIRDTLQKFPSNNTIFLGHVSSANVFMLRKTTAVCVHKSSAKFPVFAAEAFYDTVNPKGIPPDVIDDWYKQIALLIATKGVAKVAYVISNGSAFVVSYWVEKPFEYGIMYSNVFKKTGEWEKESFDAKFSHPSLRSVAETKRSDLSQKMDPLSYRFK